MEMSPNPYAPPLNSVVDPLANTGMLVGGGFWRRLAAYLIDGLIVGAASLVLVVLLHLALGEMGSAFANVLSFVGTVAYFAYLESSEWQATVGKRVLGMRVVDADGYRLSGLHALGRYVSAAVNWLLLGFGYLVVAFHPEKRGLHDLIAQTRVVLEDPNDTQTPTLAWIVIGVYALVVMLGLLALVVLAAAVSGVN